MPIGSDGIVEVFLPAGGTAGQAIVKVDSVNYNFTFGAGGGGAGSGVGGIAAGTQTATASNSTVVFSNSNNVSFGMSNSSVVTASASFNQTVQPVAFSASGGSSQFSTLVFSNASGVTFSNSNGSIQATVKTDYQSSNANYLTSQSNQAFSAQGGSSAFQTLIFTNSNGVSFSNTNGSIWGSVAAQSNQSAIKALGASNTGNTAGNTGVSTGIDWVIAGSNNITISESTVGGGPNTLWVSGPSVGGAQTGISGIVVSNTTYTSGTVSFSNANGISFGSSAGQAITASYTVPTQTNQSAIKALGVSNTGNTAGNTGVSTGIDWVIAGSNGITASESTVGGGPNTIWLSGTTYPAQSNQSAIKGLGASNTGNTAGNTGLSTGIDWVIAGSNNITISESTVGGGPNTLWVSGPSVGGAQTGISGIVVSNTTYTSGTVSFSNANGISFGSSAGQAITASYTVPTQTNQSLGLYASSQTFGQSSSSTYDARSLSIVGSGDISVGWSNSSFLISGSTYPAQTNQTLGLYGSSQTTGSASSGTYDARSLSIIGAGIISVGNHSTSAGGTTTGLIISATQSNQAFSAAGGSSAFQTLGFSDNAAASFTNTNGSLAIASVRASMYATSNTTQSSTGTANLNSLIFAGAGIASVGVTNGSVVVSVPAGGGGGDGGVFAGVSNLGNTAGSTGTVSTGNFVLVGTGGISLSQSTGAAGSAATVTVSAPASSLLTGVNGISLSTNGSTISISGIIQTNSWWAPEVYGNTLTTTFANNTVYFRAFQLDGYYNVNNLMMQMSGSSTRSTASFSASVSGAVASSGTGQYGNKGTILLFSRLNTNETHADFNKIQTFFSNTYSFGAGYSASVSASTNASSASVSVTTSGGVSWIDHVDTAGNITTSSSGTSGSTTFSSTSTNANSFSSSFVMSLPYAHLSGFRPIFAPMSETIVSPGQYWLGIQQSTSTARTNMTLESVAQIVSAHMLVYTNTTNNYMEIGKSVAITSSNWRLGFGSHSNTSGTTTSMGLTAISMMNSNASIWFAMNGNTR